MYVVATNVMLDITARHLPAVFHVFQWNFIATRQKSLGTYNRSSQLLFLDPNVLWMFGEQMYT